MVAISALSASAAQAAPPAHSADFKTPSGNVSCGTLVDVGGRPFLNCRIESPDWVFELGLEGHTRRGHSCDPSDSARYPRLAYGRAWTRLGFACRSRAIGLRCWSTVTKNGFFLSRAHQTFVGGVSGGIGCGAG